VDPFDRFQRRRDGLDRHQRLAEIGGLDPGVDRPHTGGSLRMARTGVVLEEPLMRRVEDGHHREL
jgi:hypothetical protein